ARKEHILLTGKELGEGECPPAQRTKQAVAFEEREGYGMSPLRNLQAYALGAFVVESAQIAVDASGFARDYPWQGHALVRRAALNVPQVFFEVQEEGYRFGVVCLYRFPGNRDAKHVPHGRQVFA